MHIVIVTQYTLNFKITEKMSENLMKNIGEKTSKNR